MSKKILILGASGMAGHVIYTYLKENSSFEIIGTTNSTYFDENSYQLDVFHEAKVQQTIEQIQPDIVINCVGMLIRGSKNYPDKTIYCNAYLPHLLKRVVNGVGGKLIHISTDCVFSGKDGGYTEHSFKDATDLYGMSKSLGEINDDVNLTIRTSIIGPELKTKASGEGLFHWFMTQQGEISGYKSNFWSGITTLELAKFILWQVNNPCTGLIHLTNGQPISKYHLLNLFNDIYEKGLVINDDRDYVCDKSFKSICDIDFEVPSYHTMLAEQKEFMQHHQSFYGY